MEVSRSDGGGSKEYVDGGRRRLELYQRDGSITGLTIWRPDWGVCWTLVPGSRNFLEYSLAELEAMAEQASVLALDWTPEGAEVIGGLDCRRWVGRYREPARGAYEECFVEVATGLPVRHITYDMAGQKSVVWERQSLKLGSPDSAMFEIPDGYVITRRGEGMAEPRNCN
jgi:hypothetical protein